VVIEWGPRGVIRDNGGNYVGCVRGKEGYIWVIRDN
jgi:hypothetical protein